MIIRLMIILVLIVMHIILIINNSINKMNFKVNNHNSNNRWIWTVKTKCNNNHNTMINIIVIWICNNNNNMINLIWWIIINITIITILTKIKHQNHIQNFHQRSYKVFRNLPTLKKSVKNNSISLNLQLKKIMKLKNNLGSPMKKHSRWMMKHWTCWLKTN